MVRLRVSDPPPPKIVKRSEWHRSQNSQWKGGRCSRRTPQYVCETVPPTRRARNVDDLSGSAKKSTPHHETSGCGICFQSEYLSRPLRRGLLIRREKSVAGRSVPIRGFLAQSVDKHNSWIENSRL